MVLSTQGSGLLSHNNQHRVILSSEVYFLVQIRIGLSTALQVMRCYIYNVVKQLQYGYDGVTYIYIHRHSVSSY